MQDSVRQPGTRWLSDSESRSAPRAGARTTSARSDTRILIVENEESNRALMEQILALAGYAYRSAANGQVALALLEHEPFALILLDLTMPVLDGFATVEILRSRPHLAHIPVIAITGLALEEERRRALASGCTDYLGKPFRPAILLALIERTLAASGEGQPQESE